MDTNYPKLKTDPLAFAEVLSQVLRDPNRLTGQGGMEGGVSNGTLAGGGGLNLAIPVGKGGTIVTDIGGGGFKSKDAGKFFPQGSIGYRHEWNF